MRSRKTASAIGPCHRLSAQDVPWIWTAGSALHILKLTAASLASSNGHNPRTIALSHLLVGRDDGSIPNGRAADQSPTRPAQFVTSTPGNRPVVGKGDASRPPNQLTAPGRLIIPSTATSASLSHRLSWCSHLKSHTPVCQIICARAMGASAGRNILHNPYLRHYRRHGCATQRGQIVNICGIRRHVRVG
jgi:hypothetical protein